MMHSVIRDAAKKIPNPDPHEIAAGRLTVYDTWLHNNPDANNPQLPNVANLGSGSDFTVFAHVLGIPSIDLWYSYKEVSSTICKRLLLCVN